MFKLLKEGIIITVFKTSKISFFAMVLNILFTFFGRSYSDDITDRDIDGLFYWVGKVTRVEVDSDIAGRPQPLVFVTNGSFETLENGNRVLNNYRLNAGTDVVNCNTDSMYIEVLYLYSGTEGLHDRAANHGDLWEYVNVTVKSRESGEVVGSGKSVAYSPWPYINRIYLEHEIPNTPGIYDVYLQPKFYETWDYKNKFKKNNVKLSFIVKPWASECGNVVSILPDLPSVKSVKTKNSKLRWIDSKNLSIENDLTVGKIQIYNANGSVVHSVGNVVGKRYVWNTANIPAGLYMVSFGNGSYSRVLVGNRVLK